MFYMDFKQFESSIDLSRPIPKVKRYKTFRFWIGLLLIGGLIITVLYNLQSPYFKNLSASEKKLYETLKKTRDIHMLEGASEKTTLKLFLYSIEKEDWLIAPLFSANGDGTINTSFGPEKLTPGTLKQIRNEFRWSYQSLQKEQKESNDGYMKMHGNTYQFAGMNKIYDVWYINGVYQQ